MPPFLLIVVGWFLLLYEVNGGTIMNAPFIDILVGSATWKEVKLVVFLDSILFSWPYSVIYSSTIMIAGMFDKDGSDFGGGFQIQPARLKKMRLLSFSS